MQTSNYVFVSIKNCKIMFKTLLQVNMFKNAQYVHNCLLQQHANFYTISMQCKVLRNKYKIVQ